MRQNADVCTSCGIRLVGSDSTSFLCPECGKGVIGRCQQCKNQSVKYRCTECGLIGP